MNGKGFKKPKWKSFYFYVFEGTFISKKRDNSLLSDTGRQLNQTLKE